MALRSAAIFLLVLLSPAPAPVHAERLPPGSSRRLTRSPATPSIDSSTARVIIASGTITLPDDDED